MKQMKKKELQELSGEIYQEKESFRRYLRESGKWQQQIIYIGIAGVIILLGIFVILWQISLR